ncbi:MAG: SLBB domain-containing protein, partial [Daejeonella sp.]
LTLGTLIKKAEGLTADAFLPRGYITRLKADNSSEIISFDLNKILSGSDITLQREDVINISSIFDLREEYRVSIDGEVQQPGTFDYAENMSLEDLIMKSGGFKEGASSKRVEISRRVKNSDILSASASTSEIFYIDVDKDLRLMSDRFVLQPFDIVSVRNATGYEAQRQVYVEGEVLYPGTYTVSRKDERISDLIKRAGGLTALAYPSGASLKRPGNASSSKNAIKANSEEKEKLQKLQRLQGITKKDSVETLKEIIPNIYVGINLEKILKKPGLNYDLTLEEGDTLRVPKQLQTVKVTGQVLSPATIIYYKGQDFESYISQAGGFSDRALKRRSYIIYANGSVKSTKNFIGFNIFPQVKPGAEIFVPKKAERKGLSAVEVVGISSGVASLGLIILQVINMLK